MLPKLDIANWTNYQNNGPVQHDEVANLKISPIKKSLSYQYCGDLQKLGFPYHDNHSINNIIEEISSTSFYSALIERSALEGLSEKEQDQFLKMLDEFQDIFA